MEDLMPGSTNIKEWVLCSLNTALYFFLSNVNLPTLSSLYTNAECKERERSRHFCALARVLQQGPLPLFTSTDSTSSLIVVEN